MSIRFLINKVTENYQYMSALSYRDIQLLIWICLYCIIIFKHTSYYYVSLLITTNIYLSEIFWIKFFCYIFNIIFCFRQVHLRSFENFKSRHNTNIKRLGSIRSRPIVVGKIVLWFKLSGFSNVFAIHYCNQPVLAIALVLNVTYLVSLLLISFQEAPC